MKIPPAPITPLDLDILACLPKYPDVAPAGEIAEDVGLADRPEQVAKSIARLRKNGVVIMSSVAAYKGKVTTGYGISRISWQQARDLLSSTKKSPPKI